MPNAHDLGSCRLLSALGFEALATTSGGFAASMGRMDMTGTTRSRGACPGDLQSD
jgi:2-methylisocitrate lyase-like PEP mutase family enzyme